MIGVVTKRFNIAKSPDSRQSYFEVVYPQDRNFICIEKSSLDNPNNIKIPIRYIYQDSSNKDGDNLEVSYRLSSTQFGLLKEGSINDIKKDLDSYVIDGINNEKFIAKLQNRVPLDSQNLGDSVNSHLFGTEQGVSGTFSYTVTKENNDNINDGNVNEGTVVIPVEFVVLDTCPSIGVKKDQGGGDGQ